ncbi:hypothetical protein JCM6882_000860 [Rhodosporidiobolus microsporus]
MTASPAQDALRSLKIAELILRALVEKVDADEYLEQTRDRDRVLAPLATVSSAFRLAVRRLLHETLLFTGTKAIKRWLEAAGKRPDFPTKELIFRDEYPFKAQEEGGNENAKWSFELVKQVVDTAVNVQRLDFLFFGRPQVPFSLLLSQNLRGVKHFTLGSPLQFESSKPSALPFSLTKLELIDTLGARMNRNAGWEETVRHLAAFPQVGRSLRYLALDGFIGSFIFAGPLIPLAAQLTQLSIPPILDVVKQDLLKMLLVIKNCYSLVYLRIGFFNSAMPPILEDFPPATVRHLVIDLVQGTLGCGIPDLVDADLIKGNDTWKNLIQSLETRSGLVYLEIRDAMLLGMQRALDLYDLCLAKGTHLCIEKCSDDLSQAEQLQELKDLIEATEDRRARAARLAWV